MIMEVWQVIIRGKEVKEKRDWNMQILKLLKIRRVIFVRGKD